jgi:hypothetical protein
MELKKPGLRRRYSTPLPLYERNEYTGYYYYCKMSQEDKSLEVMEQKADPSPTEEEPTGCRMWTIQILALLGVFPM